MFLQIFYLVACLGLASGYIMGVDFGSDTMKISLVQSGKPLQIITNFESKRKTPSTIAFYRDERRFGANAVALMPRKPEMVYANPFRLLGRTPSHPLAEELSTMYFPYQLSVNETSGLTMVKEAGQKDVYYTPEELTAMLLQHAKDVTEAVGEKPVKDCVITVPSSFTQHEREAVFAAAAIVDLNVLSLIEENTAAALQYAIDHNPAPTAKDSRVVVFYNMGATTTQVSVVRYSAYVVKDGRTSNKTVSQLEVIGKGFDTHLGGLHVDVKLANLLADRFNAEWNKKKPSKEFRDVKSQIKVMNKLRLESNKLKEVLSVNAEYPVKLEQLYDDFALNTKVTRKELETLCGDDDFFTRAVLPLQRAVESAGIAIEEVDALELVGGGFRMPRVKAALEEYLREHPRTVSVPVSPEKSATGGAKKDSAESDASSKEEGEKSDPEPEMKTVTTVLELGQHINSDESMALGAAFRGANLSTSFRVRKIGLVDTLNYGVRVQLREASESTSEELWNKQTVVFPSRTSLLVKPRNVAFNFDKDISCVIEADTDSDKNLIQFNGEEEGGSSVFAQYDIEGIAAFAEEAKEKGLLQPEEEGAAAPLPRVHLTFALDGQSGVVFLSKAEATADIPKPPAPVEAESAVDGSDDAAAPETADANSAGGDKENTTATDATSATASSKSKKKEDKKASKKEKDESVFRRSLKVVEHKARIHPPIYSASQIFESKARLEALLEADREKALRESTLNDLESDIYRVRNSFRDTDAAALAKVAREELMEEVVSYCNDLEEWLYDDGRTAKTPDFLDKKAELEAKVAPIYKRLSELTALPEAIAKAKKVISDLRGKVSEWEFKLPHILVNETEHVLSEINKYETWLEDRQLQHFSLSPYGDDDVAAAESAAESTDGLTDEQTTVPVVRRLESKTVTAKLKPVMSTFKKYNSKPVPKPEKLSEDENATAANNTAAEGNETSQTENSETTEKETSSTASEEL